MKERQMNGAQALVRCLENQGIECIWGLPGGASLPIFDALVKSRIKLVLTRHEQGATHMADGYARAMGKPGVVLVTSGPGATNTITGLMTAHMDSIPMVILTGQTFRGMLGKDAFQEADVFNVSMPLVKHSYLVHRSQDIPRVVREAFHITNTRRPGPVLIDLPKDVTAGPFEGDLYPEMDLPGYDAEVPLPDGEKIAAVVEALGKSRRPVLIAGHGAVIAGAHDAVRQLAEKLQAPVTTTLLGKGAFPESHRLSLGMLGMHGTACANKALVECDLVLSIGSRFDDRIIGRPDRFCRDAVRIHVDIDDSEFGRMVKCHHYCRGDARRVAEELLKHVGELSTRPWLDRLAGYKRKHPLAFRKRGGLKMQYILRTLSDLLDGKGIVVTDVGQHQMWAAQFIRRDEPYTWISSGGAGTMGFGLPAAIGAQMGRPRETVWAICGDGGFQMTMCELATACVQKLPIKVVVMNNRYLGMVRQWQTMFYEDRKSGVDLEGSPDFARLAEAFPGGRGFTLKRAGDTAKILRRAMEYNDGPCVVNALVEKAENVFPMIPAGCALEDMLISEPHTARGAPKPTGST